MSNEKTHFVLHEGNVGVCVSGGADSAILLYLIMKFATKPITIFTIASQQKQLTTAHVAMNVISKCAELTGNYNFVHLVDYVPAQTRENVFIRPEQFLAKEMVDVIYTGVTKNPPDEVCNTFINETPETEDRDPNVVRDTVRGKWITPWTNLNKADIYDLYVANDLVTTLFPFTRSCEWIPDMVDVADPKSGHCGKCWWCEERNWGFNNGA